MSSVCKLPLLSSDFDERKIVSESINEFVDWFNGNMDRWYRGTYKNGM